MTGKVLDEPFVDSFGGLVWRLVVSSEACSLEMLDFPDSEADVVLCKPGLLSSDLSDLLSQHRNDGFLYQSEDPR